MKRLLVSGGSGLTGGHIMALARDKWQVFGTIYNNTFQMNDVEAVLMDLGDEASIQHAIEYVQPDVVIHTAAIRNIDFCESHPQKAFHINTSGTEIIAEAAARDSFRLIFVSSDMVFDGKKGMYTESDNTNPVNRYGHSKLTAEKFVQTLCDDYVIARSSLIYGIPVTGSSSCSQELLGQWAEGRAANLFKDQYRTPVLVNDLAHALTELAGSAFTGIIHLGGAERTDRYSFGRKLAEIKGFSENLCQPVFMSDFTFSAERPADVSLDTALASEVLKTGLRGYKEGLVYA